MRIPSIDETLDLPRREWQQRGLGKLVQFPVLAGIGIGSAGGEETALVEGVGEIPHRLLDLFAPRLGVGHLVQAIQQDQAAAFQQFLLQIGGEIAECRLMQAFFDMLP